MRPCYGSICGDGGRQRDPGISSADDLIDMSKSKKDESDDLC